MSTVIEIVVAGPQGVRGVDAVPIGAILHEGVFDASGGLPPIAPVANSVMYTISVTGVIEGITYLVDDFIMYNLVLSKWQRVVGEPRIHSINGLTGIIVLDSASVGLDQVDNTSDAAKPVSDAQGLINVDFNQRITLNENVDAQQTIDIDALQDITLQTKAGSALAGGGDLTADRELRIDIPNAVEVTVVAGSDVLLVDTGSGVKKVTRDNLLAGVAGGITLRGNAQPRVGNTTVLNVVGDAENTSITQGTMPNFSGATADGFTYICTLLEVDKATGVTVTFGGPSGAAESITIYDQDQLAWTGDRWTHLETGDSVISVHGRNGVIVGALGDYTAGIIGSAGSSNVQDDLDALVAKDISLTTALAAEALARTNADTAHSDRLDIVEPVITSNKGRLDIVEPVVADNVTRLDTAEPKITDQGTRIEALEIIHLTDVVMPKIKFFVDAKQRIANSAGSGFAEWGKHNAGLFSESINEGLYTAINPSSGEENILYWGRDASDAGGVSRTEMPIPIVNGVRHRVAGTNLTSTNAISFPPAPDGTKTYDSVTGVVTQHASAADAFEGILPNGDFRDPDVSAWIDGGSNIIGTWDNGRYKTVTINGGAGNYQDVPTVDGVEYTITVTAEDDGSSVAKLYLYNGGNFSNPILSSGNIVDGTRTFTFTAMSLGTNSTRIRLYNSSVGTVYWDNISVRPTTEPTEQVITSRQDSVFLESWHEKISDTGAVCPLGNTQWGASTYNGLALQNNIVQGYSAFGEWDTTTRGFNALVALMSPTELRKFYENPDNNIYYDSEAGEYIQVRYRIRVIEGRGDNWTNVKPWTPASFMQYDATDFTVPRGKLTTNSDFNSTYPLYLTPDRPDTVLEHDIGCFSAAASGGLPATSIAHNGLCFAVPIALVQRRNTGAYHPAYNANGTAETVYIGGSIGTSSNGRYWYQADATKPTNTADCFTNAMITSTTRGSIGGTAPARPDNKFYDAIYASDVEDLRMSSRRVPVAELREHYKRKAIAGTVRGFEAVGKLQLSPTQLTSSASQTLITYRQHSNHNSAAPHMGYIYKNGALFQFEPTYSNSFWWKVNKWNGSAYVTGDFAADFGAISGVGSNDITEFEWNWLPNDLPTALRWIESWTVIPPAVWSRSSSHKQANPTWTDIIGDPVRIAATFPNGVEGQWLSHIPDGGQAVYDLNRKSLTTAITWKLTLDDGDSWLSKDGDTTANTTTNTITNGSLDVLGRVSLIGYETQAHFTENDVNSRVVELGTVQAGGFLGLPTDDSAFLNSSLVGKVRTANGQNGITQVVPITKHIIDTRGGVLYSVSPFVPVAHGSFNLSGLAANSNVEMKALDYLSVKDGVGKLCYAYKEMVYDNSAKNRGDFINISVSTATNYIVGGIYWLSHTSFGKSQGKAYRCVTALNLDAAGIATLGELSDAALYSAAGGAIITYFELWNGTGWGDNNQFEIVNNQSSLADVNGNTVLYGTASFKTQFFIDKSSGAL